MYTEPIGLDPTPESVIVECKTCLHIYAVGVTKVADECHILEDTTCTRCGSGDTAALDYDLDKTESDEEEN